MTSSAAPSHLPETLGDKIRWARKAAGLSHDRLALAVGSKRRHLIKLEQNLHRPGDELLARIAEATDKPLEFFIGSPEDINADLTARIADALDSLRDVMVDLAKEKQA